MVHVLPEVHSTSYVAVLGDGKGIEGSATDAILAGCVCARCGSRMLVLTLRWVARWFWSPESVQRLCVRLARCLSCKARERTLPYDALPGKQVGVRFVLECLSEVMRRPGVALDRVVDTLREKGFKVSRQLLSKWIAGVRARGDDLFRLLRHRSLIAPPGCAPTRRLVSFAQALDAARQAHPGPIEVEAEPKDGLSLVLELVGAFETIEGLALLGAQVFRQAVLLFRPPATDTSSCMAPAPATRHPGTHGTTWAGPQADRSLALRCDPRTQKNVSQTPPTNCQERRPGAPLPTVLTPHLIGKPL